MMMRPRVEDRRPLVVLLGLMIGLAWLALWLWSRSPYGRFLDHSQLGEASGGSYLQLLLLFAAGWTVMTTAMMLPTSLPLITLFRATVARRPDRRLPHRRRLQPGQKRRRRRRSIVLPAPDTRFRFNQTGRRRHQTCGRRQSPQKNRKRGGTIKIPIRLPGIIKRQIRNL